MFREVTVVYSESHLKFSGQNNSLTLNQVALYEYCCPLMFSTTETGRTTMMCMF